MSRTQPAGPDLANEDAATANADTPLFVDLDGTLIASDVTFESILGGIKRNPAILLRLPWLLLKGRARLKRELAQQSGSDVTMLPYRREVLAFLGDERAKGRRVILATASDRHFAESSHFPRRPL